MMTFWRGLLSLMARSGDVPHNFLRKKYVKPQNVIETKDEYKKILNLRSTSVSSVT